jgi:hypothetical protein
MMNQFAEVRGAHLDQLVAYLRQVTTYEPLTTLRIAVDGGVKIKVNEFSWTAPYGETRDAT